MGKLDLPSTSVSLAVANANTYSDLNGLAGLKADPHSPQAIHAVAEQVDALFLQMMLKSMREAGQDIGDHQSNELGMYQDMFDKQVALSISQRGGLGLGALVARQLDAQQARVAPGQAAPPVAPATAPAAAPIAQTPAQFIGEVLPTIRAAAQALGVNPIGLLAQAALETGWGKRMARTASGAPSLNLFGIKADEHWDGERAVSPTVEFSGGVASMRHAAFRAYRSIGASVADFADLLRGSPRYRQALAAGNDVGAYIEGIAKSGYATDPQYANKLNDILHSGVFRAALRTATSKL